MFKVFSGLISEIIKIIFQYRGEVPLNFRQRSEFHISPVQTIFNGTKSIKYLRPKIWELVPDEMKQLESFRELSNKTVETYTLSL